jgi:hypothetical protein
MPIDTSMYRQNPLRSVSDYEADFARNDLQKQQIQQNAMSLKAGQLSFQDRERAMQDQATLRNALMGLGPGATDEARIGALKGTGLPGGFQQADALEKAMQEKQKAAATVQKDTATAEKTKLETGLQMFEVIGQAMSGVTDQASYDRARQQIAAALPQYADKIDPVYNPQAVAENQQKAMSIKAQMEERLKLMQFTEMAENNRRVDQRIRSEGSANRSVQMRGQDINDARLRELTQVTKDNAASTRKEAADEKAVTKFADTLQKEGIPEIESALSMAEGAVGRYKDKPIPGVGRVAGLLPAAMLTDEGSDVRQSIAQIRNIVLQARSGAAVTDQELRRMVEELGTGAQSDDALRRGLVKLRNRFELVKANAAAGVSDTVKGTYEDRGGIKIQRGGSGGAAPAGGPKQGTIENGYRFKGGDPGDAKNWEKQ